MSCQWVKDPETGLDCFIPHCWGGIEAPGRCTCNIEGSRLEKAQRDLADAQTVIADLKAQISVKSANSLSLRRNNDRLRAEIRRLRAATVHP